MLALVFFNVGALACSRVTYESGAADSNRIVVGRIMDWLTETKSSLYVFPAGMTRTGLAGSNSLSWMSKYGSLVTTTYDLAVVDGMNSEGLVGNVLYLADGDYGARNNSRPDLSIGLWLQHFLDRYTTVAEAAGVSSPPSAMRSFKLLRRTLSRACPCSATSLLQTHPATTWLWNISTEFSRYTTTISTRL